MTTDNSFKAILDTLPPKPARSRLEPYAELIHELRSRGRTYREIARILSERCDIQTSRSTVNDFVRARSKRPRNPQKRGSLGPKNRPEDFVLLTKTKISAETSAAPDEIQKRIADLKHRQAATKTDSQIFHYDPDKPLHLPFKKKVDG
jgi:hypothetical protein